MAIWANEELRKLPERTTCRALPRRRRDLRHTDWIWSVAVGDARYVRGDNGTNSRWYQAALRQKTGRIIAAGMTKEVNFEQVKGPINDSIDDAYRSKYGGSPYLKPMIGARARAATIKVMPRGANG
jgi:hypothetical protein